MTDSTGDHPAFPYRYSDGTTDYTGLTKREEAAIKIMAGFAAHPDMDAPPERLASIAVEHADALIAELEKPRD